VTEPLSGIVLAGGRSRRLGIDKANLTFDDRTLLEIVIDRLSSICPQVIVASGSRSAQDIPGLQVKFVSDTIPGAGPLAGVQAGLAVAPTAFSLVVACDMPFLNLPLLEYMAGLPRRYQALLPRAADGWHPLHAVYARSCLPAIESLLARGSNSMEELLSRLDVRTLSEEELRRYDPEGLSLFNLNSQQDLARAQTIWKRTARGSEARSG
jgi:molybdopterin-guanine dinucleotide biosynthesis protein A